MGLYCNWEDKFTANISKDSSMNEHTMKKNTISFTNSSWDLCQRERLDHSFVFRYYSFDYRRVKIQG